MPLPFFGGRAFEAKRPLQLHKFKCRRDGISARNIMMSERIYHMLEEDPSLGTTISLCEHSAPLEEVAELRAE